MNSREAKITAGAVILALVFGIGACCGDNFGPILQRVTPTPTPTQISTPVPMPTIAPVPTATPNMAVLEAKYRAASFSVMLNVYNHSMAMGDLLDHIDFRNPAWAASMRRHIAGLRECHKAWEALEPVPDLAGYHEMIHAGFEDLDIGHDFLEEFVDTGNEDKLDLAGEFVMNASAKWAVANTLVPEGWWEE